MAFLHASYSGYFPFCIYEGAGNVGDGTIYPVGMTLEDAMALYWKAKTFRVIETWDTLQVDGGVTVTGSTDTILTPQGNLNKMSDLSCFPPIEANGQSGIFSITFPEASPPGPYFFQDSIYLYLFQDRGVVLRNGLYYPSIVLLRTGGYHTYFEWSSIIGNNDPSYTATIIINGNTYPFTIYDNTISDVIYNTTTSITIDSERETN
jgi:hypothetical protein